MLRVLESFAGYGSQSIALRNLGIEYEVVAISEIDKYAIKAYEAIHGPTLNLGDISKIKAEDIPEHDLFTYSFPCQDISIAGYQKGLLNKDVNILYKVNSHVNDVIKICYTENNSKHTLYTYNHNIRELAFIVSSSESVEEINQLLEMNPVNVFIRKLK